MFDRLKKTFPRLYEEYRHFQRLKKMRESERVKRLPFEEQLALLGETYREAIGRPLDWNDLRTYTAKMQWEKIYNDDPRKTRLADKIAVRDWVAEKIGEEYLIPLLGTWERFSDIDFDALPERFVLKTNHGSGTNCIVRDKKKFKPKRAKKMFDVWMKTDFGYANGFELHYSPIKPKILAERYLETSFGELQDYKFLCFSGKPYFCWVDMGRYATHTRNVYDLNWNLQPWNQASYGACKEPLKKPKNFEKTISLAETLCQGFQQVRVDFYNVDGAIYFGEMTFTNGRGFDRIIPEQYDEVLGAFWNIDANAIRQKTK